MLHKVANLALSRFSTKLQYGVIHKHVSFGTNPRARSECHRLCMTKLMTITNSEFEEITQFVQALRLQRSFSVGGRQLSSTALVPQHSLGGNTVTRGAMSVPVFSDRWS